MADPLSDVAARRVAVLARIATACEAVGRAPSEVELLCVSKGQPIDAIRAAYAAGQRDFGENYAQELATKAEALRDLDELRWHFIGHLQRNKARDVVQLAHVVHVVDRVELARELEHRAAAADRTLDVFVQVNVSGEPQKAGCRPDELASVLSVFAQCPHVRPVGLMTVPPWSDDPELARPFFARLRELRKEARGATPTLTGLSMGMSGDFEVAIAEGSTLVRVGTAVFGARPPRTG